MLAETIRPRTQTAFADSALAYAAWLVIAVAAAGQCVFAVYIAVFYGGQAASGHPEAWNQVLPHGYVVGNTLGNAVLAAHLLLAAAITLAGWVQLIPIIRVRFPRVHRWNGRLYVVAALMMASSGLYLVLSGRKIVGDAPQHVAIVLNAILIFVCAFLAWARARARDFVAHRRWALRLFLVVNGVWFFRVGLMFWLFVNRKPVGFDADAFTGPFLTLLSFAQTLLPLALLELYVWTKAQGGDVAKFAAAATLVLVALVVAMGEFAAFMGMWLPRL